MKNTNLIWGCDHVPFHNKSFFNSKLKLLRDIRHRLNGLYLIGDIFDLNSFSFHDKGQMPIKVGNEEINIGYEYREGNKYLDSVDIFSHI